VTVRTLEDGKPAAGIEVVLRAYKYESHLGDIVGPPVSSALTDERGRFTLTVANPGQYAIACVGPGLLPESLKQRATWWNVPSRMINLTEGETVTGINLGLIRAGFISGHVKGPDGELMAGRWMTPIWVDDNGEAAYLGPPDSSRAGVDQQGSYKLTLPPGRYKVGVLGIPGSSNGKLYRDAYYPRVSDPFAAEIVDVRAGAETSNIDIEFDHPVELHEFTGRGVAADSGEPVPNVTYRFVQVMNDGRNTDCHDVKSDSAGVLRSALSAGSYFVYALAGTDQDYYSDPISFDVNNAGSDELAITLRHSLTVNGALAGVAGDQNKLPISPDQIPLRAISFPPELGCGKDDLVTVAPDGTFTVRGVTPGRLWFDLDHNTAAKGLSLLRTEPSDTGKDRFLTIFPGDQSVYVRAIISYGKGTVRGGIKADGSQLPQGTQIVVTAYSLSKDAASTSSAADEKGEFAVDGLVDGDYDLFLQCSGISAATCSKVRQRVTVAGGKAPFIPLVLPGPDAKN
jgi:hypothetical protein